MAGVLRVMVCAMLLQAAPAGAQAPSSQGPPPARQAQPGDLSPAEVQRLFDAYALVQAQEALGLTDDQYARFVSAMKALQETQRRHQQERTRLLRELARLTAPNLAAVDEPGITAALGALKQEDLKAASEVAKAYEGVDQVLTVRQRARFRLLEEQMERRKLDLLMRARQQRREPARRRRG